MRACEKLYKYLTRTKPAPGIRDIHPRDTIPHTNNYMGLSTAPISFPLYYRAVSFTAQTFLFFEIIQFVFGNLVTEIFLMRETLLVIS